MFATWCDRHNARVLLFVDNIVRVDNTDAGVDLVWRCTCGHEGELSWRRPDAAMPAA